MSLERKIQNGCIKGEKMKKGSIKELEEQKKKEKMNELPLITVAASIYNIQDYLKRSIESILIQTYPKLEILLVDDGSTDQSGRICDDYAKRDERIRVIHTKNGGLAKARNTAIDQAKGEYIAFVDGDDWVGKEMYENMYLAMKKAGGKLAICSYKQVSEDGTEDPSDDQILYFQQEEALESFIREEDEVRIQNAAWNKLFHISLLKKIRFPEGKLFEDIAFTTKILHQAKDAVYLNQAYYNYVTDRSGSIMNSSRGKRIFSDQIPLYMEKRKYLEEAGRKDLAVIHNYYFYKRLLQHYMELEEFKPEDYKKYQREIRKLFKEEKALVKEVLSNEFCSRKEGFKLKLFQRSPRAYFLFTKINETYVVPQKQVLLSRTEPLVVIQLSGGMGNQMFQYALYLRLKALGRNVKIDDKTDYEGADRRPLRLPVFGIEYDRPSKLEMLCLTDSFLDPVSRIRRKLAGRKTAEYLEKSQSFDEKVLQMERAYLVGCWQSEKYFHDVKHQVKAAFQFKDPALSEKMKKYEKKIQETMSVSIHIRRGDYLEISEVYGGICTEEYYEKAMKQMEEWFPGCHFFVFTNDPTWVRENYKKENLTLVEGNDEDAGYLDLYLMTKCKHYILANSSFSWWGSYLGTYPGKKVIVPSQWYQGRDCRDIYTDEMQPLSLQ